ncbi:MAG: SulP family inorganic anion transporter [Myxococcales bacterium]|nr:SulP family inorganic anion transporter [Myxococcales bacterium]
MSVDAKSPAKGASGAGTIGSDALAGFLVFLIALPLCLGIAMASGFPPVAGVITAIVGGILGRFLGSARLTIKGPAAGLIVIAIGAVTELGGGDMTLGYRRALAVGVVAAVVQVIFAVTRVAKLGTMAPPSVVHGMLAAIGVIIFAKQAHIVMGVTPHAREPLALLGEIPWSLLRDNPEVLIIGVTSLVILFGWPLLGQRVKPLAKVPAPLLVLVVAIPLGLAFHMDAEHDYAMFGHRYHLGPQFLLTLPANITDAIVFPDFSVVTSAASIKYIVMFALVGTLESVLSVLAVDSLDPAKRASNLDRDLLVVAVGNLIAASLGGLPMISEIVRSKANIDNGAKSAWSNFFHGLFLLVFVATIPGLLHYIPLAALAAMLVFTGTRLASPREVAHAKALGLDQLVLFLTTLVVTLAVDLLVGIATGIVLKVLIHAVRAKGIVPLFTTRFESERRGDTLTVKAHGPATFLALLKVGKALAPASNADVEKVVLDLRGASIVDHTFLERVHGMAQEWPKAELSLVGMDAHAAASSHPHAARRLAGA